VISSKSHRRTNNDLGQDGHRKAGRIVALDESGRPSFNLLQSFRSEASRIHYFIFDMLVCNDHDLTRLALSERRQLMKSLLKLRSSRIRISDQFDVSANDMLAAVRQQQLEGIIGKRMDSLYEPGKRTGAWIKYRVNRGQELVIGGYIPGPHGFALLFGGIRIERNLDGYETVVKEREAT
jgi:ATP-dependent DNA ligase